MGSECACVDEWEEYFKEEVSKRPELGQSLVEVLHRELVAIAKVERRTWGEGEEYRVRMNAEVIKAIASAWKTVQCRVRLQQCDEYMLLGRRLPVPPAASPITATEADLELDDLLTLLDDHDVPHAASIGGGNGNRNNLARADEAGRAVAPAGTPATARRVPTGSASGHAAAGEELAGHGVAPVLKEVEVYCFPDTAAKQAQLSALADHELRAAMDALLKGRNAEGSLSSYLSIRDAYCAMSEVMNRRGLMPPRFRPQRSLPAPVMGRKATPDDTLMMRDRQVIDLHWLHCAGKRDELDAGEFTSLFAADEFDFDRASKLAAKSWKTEVKIAKVLNLDVHEEWQMACLRSKGVDDAWRNALRSMRTVIDRRLREQAFVEPGLKKDIEDLKLLWVADKMAGELGLAAISKVHGWLACKAPLALSTMSAKLRRMRRRTAPKGGRS